MILLRGNSLYECCIAIVDVLTSWLFTVTPSERFNLVDCLHEYRLAVNIHGDDVLAHNNWEISESWLQRYKYAFNIGAYASCLTYLFQIPCRPGHVKHHEQMEARARRS